MGRTRERREQAQVGRSQASSDTARAGALAGLGNRARMMMSRGTDAWAVLPALGNQARLRALGRAPRREVGHADDRFEREAHAVADAIMSGPARDVSVGHGEAPAIQRISDPGAVGLRDVPRPIASAIDGARGHGQALPRDVAASMGSRLGADLGGVRVHVDERAHQLNRSLGARAFTTGGDIFFRRGVYDPHGAAGRRVLAHELTHVVQQRGSAGPHRPIQRFVMQVGADDGYTTTMSTQLKKEHSGEEFLRFHAKWDKNWLGLNKGDYSPKSWHKPKGDEKLPSYGPSKKLKSVADGEPLRIVGHGNIRGQIGGYTGEQMGAMIVALGLPLSHTGGVDVHGCLPASNWRNAQNELQPAHIVALEESLRDRSINDTVRGYEHCIFPDIDSEVTSSAYGFFELARAFGNLPKGTQRAITEAEEQTIRDMMEADADEFIESVTRGTGKVIDGYFFGWKAREWLKAKGYMKDARLIGTGKARGELASQ